MKAQALIIALSITMVVAGGASAADEAKNAKKTKADKGKNAPLASQREKVSLTGSYIKRDVRRDGQITDGPNPVIVIDRGTIQRSGAADLRQLLVRQGASR